MSWIPGDPDPALAAVILGAGRGRRFGGPKAFLPWPPEKTLLSRAVGVVRPFAGEVLAVVSADDRHALGVGVRRIANANPEAGLAASLGLGLAALSDEIATVMVLLADQPFVTRGDVEMILAAWYGREPRVRAIRPYYNGVPGHPVVVSRALLADLSAGLAGDEGVGRALKGRDDVFELAVSVSGRPGPGFDVDTAADYRRALAEAGIAEDGGIIGREGPERAEMERPQRRGN